MFRTCAAFLSLAICSMAMASYDLLYVPNNFGTAIQRFDPVNRISLGSINTSNVYDVSANNSSSTVVGINTSNRAFGFDRSTGEFKYTLAPTRVGGYLNSSNQFLNYTGFGFSRNNADTGAFLSSTSVSGATQIIRLGEFSGGNTVAVHTTGSGSILATVVSPTNTTVGSTVLFAPGTYGNLNGITSVATVPSPGGETLLIGYSPNTTTNRILALSYTAGGTSLTSSVTFDLIGFTAISASSNFAITPGHGGSFFVLGKDAATSATRIQHFASASSSGSIIADYTTTAITVPGSIRFTAANVVAPEPGSMIALAIGIGAMLRRKKSK